MASNPPSCCGRALESCEQGLVCHECGLILECSHLTNDAESGNAMTCDGTMKWTEGKITRHTLHRGTSVSIKCYQDCLFNQTRTLRLSATVSSQIRSFLFETVYPSRKAWKLSQDRSIITASCVYVVCRQNGMVLSLRNVARVAECDVYALGRNVKEITERLDITLDILVADDYMMSVLSQFGSEDRSLESLSFDLLELCKDSLLSTGKHPVSVAIALTILAMESKGKLPRKATVVKVCGENGIKEQGARLVVNTLKDHLLEMAKEIPWLAHLVASSSNSGNQLIKKKTVAKFIPDIIKFHQQCGKLHYTISKPAWLKGKQKVQLERSQKITDAKLRLASKGEDLGDKEGTPDASVSRDDISTSTPLKTSSVSKEKQTVSDVSLHSPLDSDDKLIEYLLKKGCAESRLTEGNLESLYYSYQSPENSAINMEREDLGEWDISGDDMHKFLRTPEEIKTVKRIHREGEADGCTSKKLKAQS